MDKKNVPKSEGQQSATTRVPKAKIKIRNLARLLTCPLCKKVYKEATTINECNHTFCKECIYNKLEKEGGLACCPTCNKDLSHLTPNEYLRPDPTLRGLIETCLGSYSRTERQEPPPEVIDPAASESSADGAEASDADGKLKTRLKKKKNKTRRRRQISAASSSGKGKDVAENADETENVGEEEVVENHSDAPDDSVFSGTDDDIIEDFTEEEMVALIEHGTEFNESIWFILLPQEDEAGYPLLQKQYIHVKNGGIKSHVIMDFVMKRLNLDDDEEIELCCFGEPIMKTLTLTEVVDIWKNCMATTPPDYRRSRLGLKLGDKDMPMMHITYKRRFAPPFSPNISDQSAC